nr:Na+/H+ antiporter subunit D [Actinomycetota bacterium]NIW28564.1 Na+/H+ antiporter subunit D [Actinomycetota bacterium]NIX21042.1 Na+/H+ antiporter subunit D [Actinomycetota bacterium]
MSQLVVAPVLAALVTAVLTALVRGRPRLRAGVSLLGGVAYLAAVAALFDAVAAQGRLTYQLSAWEAPFGISLVADALSTFMLGLAAVVALAGLAYAVRSVDEFAQRLAFHPLYHLMLVGVSGSFLTGDLFNLFVWFEVMLMASYVLVVLYGGPTQTRAALTYVVLNLIGSALMLVAIGGIYSTTGTLNMADVARRLADPAAYGVDPAPVLGLSALLFAVFALKAGLVPFHFWVPGAYRAAPAPVAAVLAGVVKKVGVYAIVRLYFTVFAAATLPVSLPGIGGESVLAFYGPVLFVLAVASIVVGGVAALDRPDLDGLLAYSSVSQLGFVVLPLAVAAAFPGLRTLAIAATLVYALNHGVAKALLYLISGTLDDA